MRFPAQKFMRFAAPLAVYFGILWSHAAHAAGAASIQRESEERLTGSYNEQLTSRTYSPGIRVLINEAGTKTKGPVNLVFYALPNGNTIEHTIGRTQAPGLDWHYYIQHIGAQTRRLRELVPNEQWVVVYLQAQNRAWPSWRKQYANNAELARNLVEDIKKDFEGEKPAVHLLAHSGGGGVVFSFINSSPDIPEYVRTIGWIDANYAYDTAEKHADKILSWLGKDPKRRLVSFAYDDRNIMLDGKKVVSDTGGTFRATHRMYEDLKKSRELTSATLDLFIQIADKASQIDIRINQNPENKILHTVLVEKNGFISALAPQVEDKLWGDVRYTKWVQKE